MLDMHARARVYADLDLVLWLAKETLDHRWPQRLCAGYCIRCVRWERAREAYERLARVMSGETADGAGE